MRSIEELMQSLSELIDYQKGTEALIEDCKDQIKKYMAAHNTEEIETEAGKVTWKEVTTARFSGKDFKADHSDLYDLYTKVTTTKRFTFS